MENQTYFIALMTSFVAGMSTGLGAFIALVLNPKSKKALSMSMGFAAGIMIFVSLGELLAQARGYLIIDYAHQGEYLAVVWFLCGAILPGLIDKLLPEPGQSISAKTNQTSQRPGSRLQKVGLITALGIIVHNVPEGIATFASSMKDTKLGVAICVAIVIHNIPEGISVAMPIYYASGSKKKAFIIALLSGLAEPAGALVAMLFLRNRLSNSMFGMILSATAGIMVYIAFYELIPTSLEYGTKTQTGFSIMAELLIMALTMAII